MEFGCTIPLQKQQKIPAPPYGGGEAPIFCWDLHCISLLGRSSLLLVNCRNRYSVILYGLTGTHWARLQETALLGLRSALVLEGFPGRLTDRYFAAGGSIPTSPAPTDGGRSPFSTGLGGRGRLRPADRPVGSIAARSGPCSQPPCLPLRRA